MCVQKIIIESIHRFIIFSTFVVFPNQWKFTNQQAKKIYIALNIKMQIRKLVAQHIICARKINKKCLFLFLSFFN
jgi:hypothetical protein